MNDLPSLRPHMTVFIDAPDPPRAKHAGGRPPKEGKAMTRKQRDAKAKTKKNEQRLRCIAVLDMETDPFDHVEKTIVMPFAAALYSDQFETMVFWENDHEKLIDAIVTAIEALPDAYTIYAHNGGKFDYMFLVHKIRGAVSFKGRGIMSCRIGKHELRDSFHIIPERLAAIQKDAFDYSRMSKSKRNAYKDEIIKYLVNDCRYLFDIVKAFISEFGLKLSIGQAAVAELSKHYTVKKFSEGWDEYIRKYYYGGRVECLKGIGKFTGDYKLYDVNSMYPDVMARFRHPIGGFEDYTLRKGAPGNDTVFVDLTCDNRGALIGRTENKETTATLPHGRFYTTIWEYEIACKYNLISNVKINFSIDCKQRSDFSLFVLPQYERRQQLKAELSSLRSQGLDHGQYYYDVKRDDTFRKLIMNNGYGKYGQNPRNFKEHYLTDPDEYPPDDWFASIARHHIKQADSHKVSTWLALLEAARPPEAIILLSPHFEGERYWIWQKPCPRFNFNNVGVAASITGAARAVLLEALQHARDPIYCDTDSIICSHLSGVPIDKTALGAWDIEDEYSCVVIDGKKLYSVEHKTPKKRSAEDLARGLDPAYTVKSKGTAALSWGQMEGMLAGETYAIANRAPTLNRYGEQFYIERKIRATGIMKNARVTKDR